MGPIDYASQLANPIQSALGGLKLGGVINQDIAQRQQAEQAKQAQLAMQADLGNVLSKGSPTAADYAGLSVKYPQFNEQFKQAWDMIGTEQKEAKISRMSDVYAALESGNSQVAQDILADDIKAAENSNNQAAAKAAKAVYEVIGQSPETAKTSVALRLASMMGPDKFADTFTKLEAGRRARNLEAFDLTAAQAKAQKAAVESQFAESQAVADLQKKGWDIFKIQEDAKISRGNQKISALNADIKKESNDIKRQQMETRLQELKRKRDLDVNAKAAEVETSRGNIDNMLNTLDRVTNTPMDVIENATGSIQSRLPTLRQSTADLEELISTIDAQAFLAQIPQMKGMGALSEAEGRKLSAALQNFSLRQGAPRLMENVNEAQRILLKARNNIATRYGVPDTVPDTPASQPSAEEIDALLQKYGE